MKKKLLLILFCMISFNALHAEISWDLSDDGTLTISGTDMPEFEESDDYYQFLWYGDREKIKKVVIENGVTNIANYLFSGFSSLTSVTIPNSVISIGDYAFYGCTSLKYVTIPNSITSIGQQTFEGCSSLISVTLSNSVMSIGEKAFYNCRSLTTITIPDNEINIALSSSDVVASIGQSAFEGCESLSFLAIPNKVTIIEDNAFKGCYYLTSITIPEKLTSIGKQAFSGCANLTSINIPKSVISIGSRAFSGCRALSSVTLPNGIKSILEYTFNDCSSLTSISIPNSVTSIGECAFENCNSLPSITIPNSVTNIEKRAFGDCSFLASVDIPNSVTGIGEYAFYNCSSLASITIPNSVTNIGENAFSGCIALASISIPHSVTEIKDYTFWRCRSLATITIPNSVTSIGTDAFCDCSSLTSVTIPKSMQNIGVGAFDGCSSLTAITIPNSVTSVERYAFSRCSKLNSIVVESGNSVYDSRENCNAIIRKSDNTLICGCQNTKIPNSVTSISEYAFHYYSGLTSITIPNGVKTIAKNAFYGCDNLKEITIDVNKDLIIVSRGFSGNGINKITMYGEDIPASTGDLGVDYNNVVLCVPSKLYEKYCSTSPWNRFVNIERIDADFSSFALTDGESYINKSQLSDQDISYTRTFNNTAWQALYIPFSMSYSDWKDDFEVAYINNLRQLDTDDDGVVDKTIMDIVKIKDGSLIPNTPYLIKAKSVGEKTISVSNATIYPAEENSIDCRTTVAEYTFTGTYNAIPASTLIANNYYAMGGGALIMTDGNSGLNPYRWYMKIEPRSPMYNISNAAKEITINVVGEENEVTGIKELNIANDKSATYDMNGRMVNENNLKSGMYIKNGKKFVVK